MKAVIAVSQQETVAFEIEAAGKDLGERINEVVQAIEVSGRRVSPDGGTIWGGEEYFTV